MKEYETLTLITDEQLARELSKRLNGKFTTDSVKLMRQSGKIPYIKLGYRTLRYDFDKVLAALARREVKAITTGVGR